MSNTYNVKQGLKRCDTGTLLERDFPSEVVSVDSLTSMNEKSQKGPGGVGQQQRQQPRGVMVGGGDEVGGGASGGEYNNGDEDTIYFKPKKIYRLEQESASRQTLVRVYSDTERSNFNEVTGKRMFDDWKYRPIYYNEEVHHRDGVGGVAGGHGGARGGADGYVRRRFSISGSRDGKLWSALASETSGHMGVDDAAFGDMQDEYIPDLDFADAVRRWQAEEDMKDSSVPLTRYNVWSEDESDFNLDSASSSIIIESSHAQVSPIPFPNSAGKSPHSAANSLLTLNKALGHRVSSRIFSPSNIENKYKRHKSMYDWGSLLSMSSTGSIAEKFSQEDIKAVKQKIPDDFLSLPYTQRKKILVEIAPDKDYKTIMSLFKKYSLGGSNSFTHLSNQGSRRSRHGSMASQYLSSFTPSSASFKPDERGTVVLGHRLGKIIGFGAWGMIRDCYDVKENFIISPSDAPPETTKAIKIVKFKNNKKVKMQVLREISIWKKLHHPNILALLNWKLEDDYAAYCLTEKIQDGTLYDLVSSWGECVTTTIPLNRRCQYTIALSLQIISALKYMHSNYIVHADIKLENCLLERISDDSWKVYVCDFGMSCHYKNVRVNDDDESYDPDESIEFTSVLDGKVVTTKLRPTVPKSSSNSGLKPLTKLQKMIKSKQLTHDDTPLGISAFPKQYGPSLTSTVMSPSLSSWKHGSPNGRNDLTNEKSDKAETNNDNCSPKGMEPHSHIGSLPYAAPELIYPSPPPLGPSADIWAAGVTMYAMLTGKLPFKHEYEPRLRAMISSGKYDIDLLRSVCNGRIEDSVESYDVEVQFHGLYNAVRGCLTKDMTQRWELDMVDVVLKNDDHRN
ncbi:protein kinase NNK1 Ecym_8100 [Eremothecium cymbalariae DBVPG|uniref:non-specific serine/threonine protein kinase n=1 Tax=Eremothecium cymbalariae (strain CBS 270.75 / DBVPG 7215 / KCTC 17166 / NRRL Y-17582) TaxID=931890 RepID=G8JX20_ERECY|nr:Hypothetical protein Ecym_8100 [Eremothecium cymbalariae DBVPG\